MDPGGAEALVQEAVKAALTESAAGSGEEMTRQELRDLVAEAMAETPPISSQGDFAGVVSEATSCFPGRFGAYYSKGNGAL